MTIRIRLAAAISATLGVVMLGVAGAPAQDLESQVNEKEQQLEGEREHKDVLSSEIAT